MAQCATQNKINITLPSSLNDKNSIIYFLPSVPDICHTFSASFKFLMSPLATTGIDTLSFIILMAS